MTDREMFDVQCNEGCRLPVLDVIQQINLAYSSLSYEFSGSHAVFITPKSFAKKKSVSEEEILLSHSPLWVALHSGSYKPIISSF